jgi:uncharacterized protein YfaS (alpha-2-macroglobulin family)
MLRSNPYIRFFIFFLFFTTILSCKKKPEQIQEINPEFTSYISAFTSGFISNESAIRIQLAEDFQGEIDLNQPVDDRFFKFRPALKGSAYWVDQRTIEFKPEEPLKSGITYLVSFDLSGVKDVPSHLKTFEFQIQTIKQNFSVEIEGLKTYSSRDLRWLKLNGRILTADIIENEQIEKVLSVNQNNKSLKIIWEHDVNGKIHFFSADSVERKENEEKIEVLWNGKEISVDASGKEQIVIPALGDFKLMNLSVVQQPEQYILLSFSDPLQTNQFLQGLISVENGTDLQFIIEGNEIKAYPSARQTGILKVYIEPGIKNIEGYKLKSRTEHELSFEDIKPAIRLLGNGVILPNSDGLIFPFEAVNLKAVDVKIVRIYENNIGQFLQVNYLDGNYELKRVGRLILKKTVNLVSDKPFDYSKWNTFSIDLAELIKSEPGAIYHVELGFRKKYSLFPCSNDISTEEELAEEVPDQDRTFEEELTYWDDYESYYDYDSEYYNWDYDWNEREDPCSNSYYGGHRSVSRNILASDLGIIAKLGTDRSMTFAVTDLLTTSAVPNVTLEIYNYQQQLIGSTQTGSDGFAEIKPDGQPFYLIAKNGLQRGYLRLDDGSSLSLSRFDVSGNVVQKGIKGFIYGERGVWRPGDSLYLTFMLEDKNAILPQNHPVIFELINPHGQIVRKLVRTSGINGFYDFKTFTEPDAPTGNWSARINVGGTTFTKLLRIETIKPNRIKINIDFGTDKLSVDRPDIKGTITATWLHGAPARNLRTEINVTLVQTETTFSRYPDFQFDDPARSFSSEELTIFKDWLNQEGNATFSTDISVSTASPGMLKAYFITRVFEEGGEFSIDRFSIPYSPYTGYVGIKTPKGDQARGMLLTDTTHTVEVVTVDPDGNPVSRNNLEATIYKIDWRWWWDASDESLASYIGSSEHIPVLEEKINTRNGSGKFSFRIQYPEWGRYLIRIVDPVTDHATGKIVYVDWPGWAGREQREHPGEATMLSFSSDKQNYTVGETATISIPASGQGRALLSIENGSQIIDAQWITTTEPETNFSFVVTEKMTPNVYVNVTLVQPHSQTKNDLPIRLYGVIPIFVEDPSTRLHPVITMPDVLKPEEEITVRISEEKKTGCSYTLAIVDEGLLNLTRFQTPDPWAVLYAREALGVKTWDVFDMVLGAYGGKIEKILSIGGGQAGLEEGEPASSKADRFPPMVKFLGPFTLKEGQTNTHTIRMPRYVGSVKTMVVAGNQKAYGSTEKVTPVRKPLMVLATLPRVLGPGEEVKMPVTVFAMENNLNKVDVGIEINSLFEFVGPDKQTVMFSETGDQVINFNLKVKPLIGIGKVSVTCRSGSEEAKYDIELDIRNPNPPVTNFIDTLVNAGQTWNCSFSLPGIPGTNKARLEVSNIVPIDFGRRLSWLIQYPHGCIEQITSGAFPQLYLIDVMEINERNKKLTEENIKAAIRKLNSFVLPNGGMSYWPGEQSENDWGSSYAGHFMIEAEKKGFNLPVNFRKNWVNYQKKAARNWNKSNDKYQQSDLLQAYRLYTLALANSPDLGSMNKLREMPGISIQAQWRLAAAYALAGQSEIAQSMISNISVDINPYTGFYYSYGSMERDWAMMLETLALLGQHSRGIDLMKKISRLLSSDRWLSTQTTAYCLIAMSKYTSTLGTSNELKFDYSLDRATKTTYVATKLPIAQFEFDIKNRTEGYMTLANKGDGALFVRITMEGIPQTGDQSGKQNNLSLSVEYSDMAGRSLDITNLVQGTDFLARVKISNPSGIENYRDMVLTQIFPSGWEIHNIRMDDFASVHQSSVPDYQDIRDDRIYTYFQLPRYESKTFIIQLNAAYLGKYYLPSVYCEAMYDDRINARIPGKWIEVKQ